VEKSDKEELPFSKKVVQAINYIKNECLIRVSRQQEPNESMRLKAEYFTVSRCLDT